MSSAIAAAPPLLVLSWGNPGCGDDALGPLLANRLTEVLTPGAGSLPREVEVLTDFQLQIEHALDIRARERVLFVDASLTVVPPFGVSILQAQSDLPLATHAMSPEAVMAVFEHLFGCDPPPCELLAIRGEQFDLGAPLSPPAQSNLRHALDWAIDWVRRGTLGN